MKQRWRNGQNLLIFPTFSFWGTERRAEFSLLLLKIWKSPMLVFRHTSNSISFSILTESTLHFPMVIILKWCNILISSKVVSNKLCIISVTWREERNRIYVGKRENLRRNALALGKQQLNGTTMWQLLCVRRSAYPLSLHLKTLASIKTLRVVISIIANKLLEFALHFLIDTLLNRRYFIHT